MEKKCSLILDKEFIQYCKLNDIEDVEKLAKETFQKGFALLKYGDPPSAKLSEYNKNEYFSPKIPLYQTPPLINDEKKPVEDTKPPTEVKTPPTPKNPVKSSGNDIYDE